MIRLATRFATQRTAYLYCAADLFSAAGFGGENTDRFTGGGLFSEPVS